MSENVRRRFPALPSFFASEGRMLILFEKIDGRREATISEAFTVAQCAREIGDMVAATGALRVIDALLHNGQPHPADMTLVKDFWE
jgi:hypothetical protein